MQRKVFVGAAEAGNEMVFEGADGASSGVSLVEVWRHQLEINVLFMHVLF